MEPAILKSQEIRHKEPTIPSRRPLASQQHANVERGQEATNSKRGTIDDRRVPNLELGGIRDFYRRRNTGTTQKRDTKKMPPPTRASRRAQTSTLATKLGNVIPIMQVGSKKRTPQPTPSQEAGSGRKLIRAMALRIDKKNQKEVVACLDSLKNFGQDEPTEVVKLTTSSDSSGTEKIPKYQKKEVDDDNQEESKKDREQL